MNETRSLVRAAVKQKILAVMLGNRRIGHFHFLLNFAVPIFLKLILLSLKLITSALNGSMRISGEASVN